MQRHFDGLDALVDTNGHATATQPGDPAGSRHSTSRAGRASSLLKVPIGQCRGGRFALERTWLDIVTAGCEKLPDQRIAKLRGPCGNISCALAVAVSGQR